MAAAVPESWTSETDLTGKQYYTDNLTGEWYRLDKENAFKRMDTMEKIAVVSQKDALSTLSVVSPSQQS